MLRKIFAKVSGKTEQQIMNEQLRTAALGGNLARVQKLVKQGAEVDYKDVNGLTPLYFAAGRDYRDIARFLLEKGADPNVAREDSLGPPLVQAAYHGHLEMIKLLLEFKADINAINYSRRTGLHEAVSRGQDEAALLLLGNGASPETVDRMGNTPLWEAIGYGRRDVARALAEKGADAAVEYKYGIALREKALQLGWTEVVQAADDYRAGAAREAAAEKAALDKNLAKASVLQSDIGVRKPLIIKPKTP